ncbi:MAG: hypothetical protein VX017_10805, partial [Pseudomonadota bacterium]|nr:hypothetical protein [Pseudomonadota bacterium]
PLLAAPPPLTLLLLLNPMVLLRPAVVRLAVPVAGPLLALLVALGAVGLSLAHGPLYSVGRGAAVGEAALYDDALGCAALGVARRLFELAFELGAQPLLLRRDARLGRGGVRRAAAASRLLLGRRLGLCCLRSSSSPCNGSGNNYQFARTSDNGSSSS